jgi:hypothetical protein
MASLPGLARGAPAVAVALASALAAGGGCAGARAPAPPPQDDPAATPVEVTRAFYAALHGFDAPRAAALVASPSAPRATAAFVTMARAYESVERALQARYGRAVEGVGYDARVAAENAALMEARAQVDGDAATVTGRGMGLASLRRTPGGWRVLLDDALGTEAGLAALERDAEASRRAAERVVPTIQGGLFDDPDDALQAFRNELASGSSGEAPDLPDGPQERGGPDEAGAPQRSSPVPL